VNPDPIVSVHTDFRRQMATTGLVLFPGMLNEDELAALRSDSEAVYERRRVVQMANGLVAKMEGTAHHVVGESGSLDCFIANLPLWKDIAQHFDGKFILLKFGATLHPPGETAYTLNPHRDVRAWTPDFPLSLNMLVMLDDFTKENGATLFLEGSQHFREMPPDGYFKRHARQREGKAGDILLFDSLVVHAAAPNYSAVQRRALTLSFGRPFMKAQMDWPRFLPASVEAGLTPHARQLLGYDARVAASLEEYYQLSESWAFKGDQR
jgi:Phytanoyl-CoA dioxygenase (PhyH)